MMISLFFCCTAPFIQPMWLTFRPFQLVHPAHNQHCGLWTCEMTGESVNEAEGRCPKRETIKVKGGTEWIHSADHDIARGTCANNRPVSLDLGVFVQNYTEALCSQTALETALMFIQIPDECRITVTLISTLVPRDKRKGSGRINKKCLKPRGKRASAARCGLLPFHFFFFFPLSAANEKRNIGDALLSSPAYFVQLPFAWNYYEWGGFVAAFHPLDSTSLIAVPSIENVPANLNAPAKAIRWHAGARAYQRGKQQDHQF